MRRFSDHPPAVVAAVTVVVLVVAVLGALNLTQLPFINHPTTYRAEFPNAGGLTANDVVTIDGVRVGDIKRLALKGSVVQVTFTVSRHLVLGVDTTAAAKVQTPLGSEFMELTPAGPGRLKGPIPESHVSVPYTLIGDLSQLTTRVEQYNIPQLVKALQTSSVTLDGSSTTVVAAALSGLARFSSILADNHSNLAAIVTEGSQLSAILSQRSGELVNLVGQGDLILQVLAQRQAAIRQLLDGTAALSAEITNLLGPNRDQLDALLGNLRNVSAALAADSGSIATALPLLAALSRYAANITGSGPFGDVSLPTLLIPDNVIRQCSNPAAYPSSNPLVGCRP